jgi:hypothetical protein
VERVNGFHALKSEQRAHGMKKEIIRLSCIEKNFLNEAKAALVSGAELVVTFQGKQAASFVKCIPFLMEMQKFRQKDKNELPWIDLVKMYVILNIRFWRFMIIFWMALAGKRYMRALGYVDGEFEVGFEKLEQKD